MKRVCLSIVALAALLGLAKAASYTSPPGVSQHSYSATVSAAGTTLATGTPLVADLIVITTCASGAGVVLSGLAGQTQEVWNASANSCLIYPPTTAQSINGGTAGAAVTLATNYGHGAFSCISATACVQAP